MSYLYQAHQQKLAEALFETKLNIKILGCCSHFYHFHLYCTLLSFVNDVGIFVIYFAHAGRVSTGLV